MTKRSSQATILVALFIVASLVSGNADNKSATTKNTTIIDLFVEEFRTRNEKINMAEIQDIRWASSSKETGYIVVARGFRSEQRSFAGSFEDELFGVFAVDKKLGRVIKKIDIVRTPRWNDYWCTIKGQATWDEVAIECVEGYGAKTIKKYSLKSVPWPGFVTPNTYETPARQGQQ